jgi:diguanylate cyclase (GGDEF)-like protein
MTTSLSANQALAILNHCPFPLLVFDVGGQVLGYNKAFEQLVGPFQAREVKNRDDLTSAEHLLNILMSNEKSVSCIDRQNRKRQFEIHQLELPGEARTRARFFVEVGRELQATGTNSALKEHAFTDDVTGLLNQRGVLLALEPQVARSRRYNSPISIVMMDVSCNGDCGDALSHVARLLKDQLRWSDLVACTENREFMLVLPETDVEAALKLADILTTRLRVLCHEQLDGQQLISTYGVAGWRRSDNANSLIQRAAQALSQARSERNARPIAL